MSGIQWTTKDYLYVTAECVTGILSLLGNTLVLAAIKKSRVLRTPTNCFIGSLAAADALVGLIIPPTVILPYLGLPKHFHACVFVNSVVVLITNISILNLLAVALERYLAVKSPFFYQRVISIQRALSVVAVTWIIAILIGLIPLMGWHMSKEGFKACAFTAVIDLRYMVYLIFFGMTVPLLLAMLVIYLYIFHIIRQQQKRARLQAKSVMTREMRRNARQQKQEVRGAKGLAYVIILFAVCWLPLHIMNSVTVFAPEKSAPYELLLVAIVLSHANSVVNPFLYAFSNSKFKYAMKRILCCGRGQPFDFESSVETAWNQRRTSDFASKEVSIQSGQTLPSVSAAESLESLHSRIDQLGLSNNRQITNNAQVSATSLNGFATRQRVCNGNDPHTGKSPSKLDHLIQHEVTTTSDKEETVVEVSNKGDGRPLVKFAVDDIVSSSGSMWMTSSSQRTELDHTQSLQEQHITSDLSSDKQSNGEHIAVAVTQAEIVNTNSDKNSDTDLKGTAGIYPLLTIKKTVAFLGEKEDLASRPTAVCGKESSVQREEVGCDTEDILSVRL